MQGLTIRTRPSKSAGSVLGISPTQRQIPHLPRVTSPNGQRMNESPKESPTQRTENRLKLKLPKCPGDFQNFAFNFGYKRFVESVQMSNGNTVSRKKVEAAWDRVIHEKFNRWNPADLSKGQRVGLRGRALKLKTGSKAWQKSEIDAYFKAIRASASNIIRSIDNSTNNEQTVENKNKAVLAGDQAKDDEELPDHDDSMGDDRGALADKEDEQDVQME